jgi:hypothetical protein
MRSLKTAVTAGYERFVRVERGRWLLLCCVYFFLYHLGVVKVKVNWGGLKNETVQFTSYFPS